MVDEVKWYRAGGDVICTECNKPYKDHPMDKDIHDQDGNLYLNVLCNGDRVKL
jgi:hypothetical protein